MRTKMEGVDEGAAGAGVSSDPPVFGPLLRFGPLSLAIGILPPTCESPTQMNT
jgi:hypothetical protein